MEEKKRGWGGWGEDHNGRLWSGPIGTPFPDQETLARATSGLQNALEILTSCNILSKGFNYIFIFHPHFFHHLLFFFWSFKAFARCLLESMGPSKPPSMGFGSVLCLQLPDDTIWERGCHNTPVFCKRKQKFSVTNCSSYMLWQRLEAILFSHWTHLDSSHANAIIQKFLKRGLQYTAVASGSVSFVEFSADWWQRCRVSLEKQKTGSELSVQ